MKKTKEIQELKVDGDGLVQGKLADPSNFEYDPVKTLIKFYSFLYGAFSKQFIFPMFKGTGIIYVTSSIFRSIYFQKLYSRGQKK